VQGLTEFLPVSSSGHLVVANAVLVALGYPPAQDLLEVEIILHLGTLLAIFVFFWREIWQLFVRDWRLIPLLVVATIPAVVIGLPLKEFHTDWLESPLLAGFMFPVTAALLIWGARQPETNTSYRDLSYAGAVKIGLLQALALLPGVSRSGSTIAGGLLSGLDRRGAATFAFLLAIPAIGGAGLLEVLKLIKHSREAVAGGTSAAVAAATTAPLTLVVGALVSMLVGLFALWWLLKWVQQGRLALFAWYLVPLGVAVIVWRLAAH
jgi:undecaprenyl-diphosphatase